MADVEKSQTRVSPLISSDVDTSETSLGQVNHRRGWLARLKGQVQDPDELGKELFAKSQQYDEAQLERDAVRVRRKLDFILLPLMCGTYMISFLDKQTLNYSNAYGLQADTNMSGDDYSWVASALNFGWLLAAYPWTLILQRYPTGRLIGGMLFVWGSVCMLQAAVFDFGSFFAVRFWLGALEAVVSPAFILLTSMFWTSSEQSLRSSFWLACNGFSSILGALLAYGAGHAEGLIIPNWKLIYLIVGCMTIVWGVVISLYLPDGPHNAKMLSDYEKIVAVWRISKNKVGLKHKEMRWYQVREAATDPRVWLIWLMGAAVGVLNGGVVNFASALIKGFGFNALQASLIQTPGGAFEIIGCIIFGYLSTLRGWLGISIILSSLPGMAGLIGILTIDIRHRYALTAMAWMQNVLGSPIILVWSLPGINVAGHSKRSFVLGMFFVVYCAGNIASPHMFLGEEAPRYPTAIKGLLGAYVALIVFAIAYIALVWLENKRRDRKGLHGEVVEELAEGFEDKTDVENKHFRYRI
ncbi:putative transporter [Cyphellophora attinorum]|uniref:Putative transporter n=1 Tax=Cyphellophora attinorum TaxID=1664694 RepID=A0A0N1NVW3_9EURO|nr:putative transporter [Phialophora attinorum]KPI34296.1 putative transporter [Phialophora attinorum]